MKIIYWTGTGNTKEMVDLISIGIQNQGKDVEVVSVENADLDTIKDEEIIILGCPAMGDEVLEESEFEPFISQISTEVNGKKVALFGSYGWGDGQWMRDWEERMISYGANIVKEPLIVNNFPENEDAKACIKFGEYIASL